MLRALSAACLEGRALEALVVVTRRDALASIRRSIHGSSSRSNQTVLSSESEGVKKGQHSSKESSGQDGGEQGRGAGEGLPPPPVGSSAWPAGAIAAAAALTASLGGVYAYRKFAGDGSREVTFESKPTKDVGPPPYPASGDQFPSHVQYLIAGAGTAGFAAMRAIRSAHGDSAVLLVGAERALPYMRPPLSKELWREPELATKAATPDTLTFRQWNGKRRAVVYEPSAFYAPVEGLEGRVGGGAAVARGWSVTKIDVLKHEAELSAPGQKPVTIGYDKCLVATGVRARRMPVLREAAARGRSLTLRSLEDVVTLATKLDEPSTKTVAVIGGGFLATELSCSLADRLAESGKRVVQVVAEEAPMAAVLPGYLAQDAARRLQEGGVELLTQKEVVSASVNKESVSLELSGGQPLEADLVVECVGSELEPELAAASGLETHPELGGLMVNAELQARADVWAAGDAACFYDVVLGRRRVEHHDHAVVSGRLAGSNMAADATRQRPKHYTHQSMFWSDLGPQLGYEAIGIIDSRLPTVGIFSADAVREAGLVHAAESSAPPADAAPPASPEQSSAGERQYERGVVFYLRGQRVVGVLLWNLFNRMHVARQVLAQGEFEDLFEVGKLFAPHEED